MTAAQHGDCVVVARWTNRNSREWGAYGPDGLLLAHGSAPTDAEALAAGKAWLTAHGYSAQSEAVRELLDLAKQVAEITDGTFHADDRLDNLDRLGKLARDIIAKAKGGAA